EASQRLALRGPFRPALLSGPDPCGRDDLPDVLTANPDAAKLLIGESPWPVLPEKSFVEFGGIEWVFARRRLEAFGIRRAHAEGFIGPVGHALRRHCGDKPALFTCFTETGDADQVGVSLHERRLVEPDTREVGAAQAFGVRGRAEANDGAVAKAGRGIGRG